MELYLFRHGIAADPQPGKPDSDRELTPEGRDKASAVARHAGRAGLKPTLILTSPYARARQTAAIAANELGFAGPTLITEALVPFGTPEGVWDELRLHSEESAIILAGHEPLLSQLAAFLLHCPELQLEMKKATLVRIDVDGQRGGTRGLRASLTPAGTLRWILTAKLAAAAR